MTSRWSHFRVLGEAARFAAAGAANTAFTIVVYQLFVGPFGAVAAYAVAWAAGLLIVAIWYPSVVYRLEAGLWRRCGLVLGYILVFCFGMGLTLLLERIGMPSRLIVFLVAAATTAANYFGGRWSLRAGRETAHAHE
jgi:putative flippase GtrA